MFPLDDGKSADQFGVLSPTFKARFLKDELRIGTLYQNNPMLANTDGRLYRQTNTGAQLVSKDLTTSPSPSATSTRPRSATKPATPA